MGKVGRRRRKREGGGISRLWQREFCRLGLNPPVEVEIILPCHCWGDNIISRFVDSKTRNKNNLATFVVQKSHLLHCGGDFPSQIEMEIPIYRTHAYQNETLPQPAGIS